LQPIQRKPSDYLKNNFHITNSGVAWGPALKFTQEFMSNDRVMYAMDYPYQYVPEEVSILENIDMTPAVRQSFFQDNAARLFKIKL